MNCCGASSTSTSRPVIRSLRDQALVEISGRDVKILNMDGLRHLVAGCRRDAPPLTLSLEIHLAIQVARGRGQQVYAFTRPDDREGQFYARTLGAEWAGSSDQSPPHLLDASLIFAPVGALVPLALEATAKGGCVICAGIHMSDIPGFPYRLLWGERSVRSVANLTREDGMAFFEELQRTPVHCDVTCFALDDTNQALAGLRAGQFNGAIVLTP